MSGESRYPRPSSSTEGADPLLFFKEDDMGKVSEKWTQEEVKLLENWRLYLMGLEIIKQTLQSYLTPEEAQEAVFTMNAALGKKFPGVLLGRK